MTGADMTLIATHRTYVLYPGAQGSNINGNSQVHYLNGGVALSGDSTYFTTEPANPTPTTT